DNETEPRNRESRFNCRRRQYDESCRPYYGPKYRRALRAGLPADLAGHPRRSSADAQRARNEDNPTSLRPRWRRTLYPRRNRKVSRNYPGTSSADQGKGDEDASWNDEDPRLSALPRIVSSADRTKSTHNARFFVH